MAELGRGAADRLGGLCRRLAGLRGLPARQEQVGPLQLHVRRDSSPHPVEDALSSVLAEPHLLGDRRRAAQVANEIGVR